MDRKKDKFLTDIFDSLLKGKTVLTSKQEERLYERYWGKLMAVAQRYVQDRESAREIVNDSFVKAFDKLSTFKGKGKNLEIVFQAWLVRITVHTAIDRYRADVSLAKVLSSLLILINSSITDTLSISKYFDSFSVVSSIKQVRLLYNLK